MIPHKNTVPHNPPHSYGDCHRCCIATIMGLDPKDVPHFYDGWDAKEGFDRVNEFLRPFGLNEIHILFPGENSAAQVVESVKESTVPMILGGVSRTGCGHSVVIYKGEIFNDPSGTGIVGPFDSGFYHVSFLAALPDFAKKPY